MGTETSTDKKDADRLSAEVQELSLLLESRTFVDYFNIYLCLPVFGQHVLYKYIENEFEFEPPIRNRKDLYLDRREVLRWLCKERFRSFKQSQMYVEYKLCLKLKSAAIELQGFPIKDDKHEQDKETFIRNVIGSVTGMLLFRESMRGTCGANVYECWKDMHVWKQIDDPDERLYRKYALKNKYISTKSITQLQTTCKCVVYQGQLNFELIPAMDADGKPTPDKWRQPTVLDVDSDEALLKLHDVLLEILRDYWLSRHFFKLLQTTSEETIDKLRRPAPRDFDYLDQERKLRCRLMFPSSAMSCNTSGSSPVTSIFVSRSAHVLCRTAPDFQLPDFSDLLSLWGGPSQKVDMEKLKARKSSSLNYDEESQDVLGKRRILTSHLGYAPDPIPDVLTSFMGGKKRSKGVEEFPNLGNRVIWSLTSDTLACSPFRMYLEEKEKLHQLKFLCFWTDLRKYLDLDDEAVDSFGRSSRKLLAEKIKAHYLECGVESLFTKNMRQSVSKGLDSHNDASALFKILDLVQESLWQSLTDYFSHERRMFLKQVRGRRVVNKKGVELKPKYSLSNEHIDVPYTFGCSMFGPDSATTVSSSSPYRPVSSAKSDQSYRVSITEEQLWKAMELTVLCVEYGNVMMVPSIEPTADSLVAVLYNDYGSLYVHRVAAVRHPWLRHLMPQNRPKINIATLKVSKKVILDKVDIEALKRCTPNIRTRVLTKRDTVSEKPLTKPKSFAETMTSTAHFEHFKRFMISNKCSVPVAFWRTVEDLKYCPNAKIKQGKVGGILSKFFGKNAKNGAMLDCDDDIIKNIPHMDQVTPGILICAQAAVCKSMESKWFREYLKTYPSASEDESTTAFMSPGVLAQQAALLEEVPVTKFADLAYTKVNKHTYQKHYGTKTFAVFKNMIMALVEFNCALKNPHECQMLGLFLKCEVEKEREHMPTRQTKEEKNNTSVSPNAVGPRLVVKGRLVAIQKLPFDYNFWLEILKYQSLVDSATRKGNISSQDSELLNDKARSIIVCYLNSEVPPKIQVNIPPDMAMHIILGLSRYGPYRGLFHEALMLLFPLLYHYYRKYAEEWIRGKIPAEYISSLERAMKERVCDTPHKNVIFPDYTNILLSQIKQIIQPIDDSSVKISFSIATGACLIMPEVDILKTPTVPIQSITKESAIYILQGEPTGPPIISITTDGSSSEKQLKFERSPNVDMYRKIKDKDREKTISRNESSTGKKSSLSVSARSNKPKSGRRMSSVHE